MRIEPLPAIFSVNIDNLIAVPSGTVGNIFPTGRNINDILFLLFFSPILFFFFLIIILPPFSLSFFLFFSLLYFIYLFFFVEIRRRSADSIIRAGWKHLFCLIVPPVYTSTRISENVAGIIP